MLKRNHILAKSKLMAKSILSTGQLVIKARPDEDDVVVRQKRSGPITVYVSTTSASDQFLYRTRAPADLQALAFAKHAHVAAWFTNGDATVPLGTKKKFRNGTS